ncbi:MAG: glycosyltransferase family 39 protein [Cyanobacteria bacterium]|nr:glycosyltransferase family 39 protein [Cyanobacteriota bacterium]
MFILFLLFLFIRFYDIEGKNLFGWDQVNNAWAAKNILVDRNFPLLGMTAKLNSGINIGPAYYYLISFFYKIYDLDPVASGVFAGLTAVFTFWVLFYAVDKIFSFDVAILSVFIYTVSNYLIIFDRVQWPVNFIPAVSILIFYFLYNTILGKLNYLPFLFFTLGFAFNIHFTSVFFVLLIFLLMPFFPWTKKIIKYFFISIPLFLIWIMPNLAYEFLISHSSSGFMSYIFNYYHGFHLVRFFQLTNDAFIELESLLYFKILKFLKFILVPAFIFFYLRNYSKEKLIFCYLLLLWFIVPWIVFTTYKGEISNYYFSLTLPLGLIVISYLLITIFKIKNIIPKILALTFGLYYVIMNITSFINSKEPNSIGQHKLSVKEKMKKGEVIQFVEGNADSYIYYYFNYKK